MNNLQNHIQHQIEVDPQEHFGEHAPTSANGSGEKARLIFRCAGCGTTTCQIVKDIQGQLCPLCARYVRLNRALSAFIAVQEERSWQAD